MKTTQEAFQELGDAWHRFIIEYYKALRIDPLMLLMRFINSLSAFVYFLPCYWKHHMIQTYYIRFDHAPWEREMVCTVCMRTLQQEVLPNDDRVDGLSGVAD